MTVQELADITKLSRRQINRFCAEGSFHITGHGHYRAKRSGNTKTSPWLIESVQPDSDTTEPLSLDDVDQIKHRKLVAETEYKEQQAAGKRLDNERMVMAYFSEWSDLSIEAFIQAFSSVRTALKNFKLPADQLVKLQEVFEECTTTYSAKFAETIQAHFSTILPQKRN